MASETNTSLEKWSPLKRFFNLLKLDSKDITYIYIYSIFSGLITLSLPLGVQAIIGLIVGGEVSTSLVLLVLVVTIGTALAGVLKVMQLVVTETMQRRIFVRSAFEFGYRMPRLSLEGTLREYPPELVNRFFDTLTLQKGLPKLLMDFSSAILQIVFGLILISFYHSFFVLFGFILIMTLIIIFRVTGPAGLKTSLKESTYKYAVANWLEELARNMTTFKLAGDSPLPIQKADQLTSNYLDNRKNHFRILIQQYVTVVGFKTIVTGALLFLGSYLVIENRINIGQFVASEIVVILIIASVEKIILSMETVYDVLTAAEKIGIVTDLPLDQAEGLPFASIDSGKGISLELEKLTFQFGDANRPTLDNLSLKINSGEKVCISGYNGSGKSTLLQIVSGYLTQFKGGLTYNGFPVKNINLESLRNQVGDYSSNEDIFNGTIIENICLGHEYIGLEEVILAAKKIGLDESIKQMPKGYNTQLIVGGRNVPKTIRAKIILARSIVHQPKLLVIEDLFSILPHQDKQTIINCITNRENPWTLLVVSNDEEIAAKCDRTILLDRGKILEEGNFDQLKNSQHFKKLFNK